MRRKDREMNKEFGYDIIDNSSYGIVSLVDGNQEAYGIPLSLVREGDLLYFHSAKEGKKVHLLKESPRVWVSFVGETKIPENYSKEELEEIARDESKHAIFLSRVFTTEYQSAMVKGRVEEVESFEEKSKALKLICEKYTPSKMDYFNMAIRAGINRVNIYRIRIEDLTAKRKKYDSMGEEMKWGRME